MYWRDWGEEKKTLAGEKEKNRRLYTKSISILTTHKTKKHIKRETLKISGHVKYFQFLVGFSLARNFIQFGRGRKENCE